MKIRRNEPCACGSGRKYKHCCGHDEFRSASRRPGVHSVPVAPLEAPSAARTQRPCAGCVACCTTTIINDPAMVKPAGVRCRHACAAGCAIHDQPRPSVCAAYQCAYTTLAIAMSPDERPDKVGAIVDQRTHPSQSPPMNRTTHVMACAPDGLVRVARNPIWREVLRRDLCAGVPILAAQHEDPLNREVLGVRWQNGRLDCRLPSCHADGSPILVALEPVYAKTIEIALLIPQQGFVFAARALVALLGERTSMVVGPSRSTAQPTDLRFYFTRRMAAWIEQLEVLVRDIPAGAADHDPVAATVG